MQQGIIFTVSSSTNLSSSSYGNCDEDNDEGYDADNRSEATELKHQKRLLRIATTTTTTKRTSQL